MASISTITTTGLTLYLVLRDENNQPLIGSTPEVYDASHWDDYAIEGEEQGDSGFYSFTTPSGISEETYTFDIRRQAGATPDVSDSAESNGSATWDGESWTHIASDDGTIVSGLAATIALNATGPRRAQGDGQMVEQHSLPDQILADKYLKAQNAVSAGTGIKFTKLIPPNQD